MATPRVTPEPAHQAPQQDDHRPPAELHASAIVRNIMIGGEGGFVSHFYNDQASNCTYGAGTLAHYGRCTPAELAARPPQVEMNARFQQDLEEAENTVRRAVTRPLTQGQFDALVSLAYNAGPRFSAPMFHAVNRLGPENAGPRLLTTAITVAVRDQNNNITSHRRSQGLVNRRHRELAVYQGRAH